ncbi:hypothetical protein Q73A0000_01370 [Kaistella flava (ex Peng et al. 2021)]|uniref:Helix-turn-helix domain-containing protein n=1 Tax=Kaistella flava (ex Peng et al. 2021) TaxID=2038776 RepID=A0A7M2Y6P0_9FLAO|nr:hypothetical protein [Kaistella flava (ex Peng et al. 2021)]QOW09092.1 hypothetical protein Q73A0000_01370 [Kaistella flava (ex Peng et al. 2021)]
MNRVKVDKSLSKNYFQYEKTILHDRSLSLKAKGMHALIMSLPDSWVFSVAGIITMCKESKDSVYSGIKELEQAKYVKKQKLRSGHTEYTFFEIPYNNTQYEPNTENTDKANTENPNQGNPNQGNPTLLIDSNSIKIENSIKRTVDVIRPIFVDEIKTKEFLLSQKITIDNLARFYKLGIDLVNSKIHEFVEKKFRWEENTWSSEKDLKKNFELWLNSNVTVNSFKSLNKTEERKKVAQKKEIEFPFPTKEFKASWDLWKLYRKKKDKFQYFDEQSEQKALSELFNLSKKNESMASLIIRQSIDKGWKGFFEINTSQSNGTAAQSTLSRAERR